MCIVATCTELAGEQSGALRPRVTVLTATYNGSRYLAETLESILAQTFRDFEYIVVDDASTDDSAAIVAEFARRDGRIRLVRNAKNRNPAGALNVGLAQARGEYVAILDHDDLALPERLAQQVAFLDAHPDYGAVGARVRFVDENGELKKEVSYPVEPVAARWHLLFAATLLHSASMYRRDLLIELGGYSVKHPFLCDYELLIRIAERARIGNLPACLAHYRQSASQVSATHYPSQTGQMFLLQYATQARWLGVRPHLPVFQTLFGWLRFTPPAAAEIARAARDHLHLMIARYLARTEHAAEERARLTQLMARHWLILAHAAYKSDREIARLCWHDALALDPDLLTRPQNWETLRRPRKSTPEPLASASSSQESRLEVS